MRRLLLWSLVAGFTACLLKPTIATVTPDYGYVDGCESVILQGHDLGVTGKARIGEVPFLSLEPAKVDPKAEEWAQDVGFEYYGIVPPAPGGEPGWYDVVLEVDGVELVIDDGWYYRSCPGRVVTDSVLVPCNGTDTTAAGAPCELEVGATIFAEGCGLDGDVTLQFLTLADPPAVEAEAAIISDCSSAQVHAVVPALPPGDYSMAWVAGDGSTVLVEDANDCPDSGDTASTCAPLVVTVPAR